MYLQTIIMRHGSKRKLTIYYSFILSNFNYCPVTWHFCSEKNTKKNEKIQERALRFIYEDYENTYENLLKKSKLPSLKIRRLRTIAVETFKIIHKQSPSYLHDLISIKDQKYNFRHTSGMSCRKETSLEHFKNIIHTWNGSSCQCSACRWPLNFYF